MPVVEGKEVLGAFTYRSFALGAASIARGDVSSMPALEFVETLHFARPRDDFEAVIEALDRDGAVFVGEPDQLIGIATTVDVLRYLLEIANAFVLLQEIELGLRELLRAAAGGDAPADWMLKSVVVPDGARPKSSFRDLAFGDYRSILEAKGNWEHLAEIFGAARIPVLARVKRTNEIRNIAFHFRQPLSVEDHADLAAMRDWLLLRIRIANARRAAG